MAKKTFYKTVAFTSLLLLCSSLHLISSYLSSDSSSSSLSPSHNYSKYYTDGVYGRAKIGRHMLAEDDQCRDVHIREGDEQCEFVRVTTDCDNEGFFNYNYFTFCIVKIVPLAMLIFALWLVFCFIGLAVCADDFFCPSLVVISKTLRLTPNVAGVTFLAFGNGAPDFFSAISALSTTDGETGMGIGGLFGAGMFVTTIVVGTICVVTPFKAMERPFLRDLIFYMCAVYTTFYVLWQQRMGLVEAIAIMSIYPVYVLVVIISSSVYKKQQEAKLTKNNQGVVLQGISMIYSVSLDNSAQILSGTVNQSYEPDSDKEEKHANGGPPVLQREDSLANIGLEGVEDTIFDPSGGEMKEMEVGEGEEGEPAPTWWWRLIVGINPINIEEWPDMSWYGRVYEIFKSPIMFLIQFTCPVINYDDEVLHNWNKYLQMLQCFTAPIATVFLTQLYHLSVVGPFKLWMLMIAVGLIFAVIIMFTSSPDIRPVYHSVFGYVGFVVALVWIYVIASEIVSLLETIGLVANISTAILGLTLLAWGNSIGDWVSNVVMARQGFARMGFAACFGAPLFNLCLGFGIPMIIQISNSDSGYAVLSMRPVNIVLGLFLLFSLVSSLVIIPVFRFKVRRVYGLYLLTLYIVFLIVTILTETGAINIDSWFYK